MLALFVIFSIYSIYYIPLSVGLTGEKLVVKTKTIDITPTWVGLLPYMIAVLEDGTHESKETIKENFERMAAAADLAVELTKSDDKQTKLEVEK